MNYSTVVYHLKQRIMLLSFRNKCKISKLDRCKVCLIQALKIPLKLPLAK